MAKSAPIVGV